ncbi:MAG: hypothetical protein R2701_07685 [Acidimicrobiales bacterium]|nr:hypothetical protein [Acidimicrobiales bacterium]
MAGSRRKGGRRRNKLKPTDLWRPVPQLPDPEPIEVAIDPTMIVRSLGDPPLHGQGQLAEHEINRVMVRASMLAGALADVAGLLDQPGAEPDE